MERGVSSFRVREEEKEEEQEESMK